MATRINTVNDVDINAAVGGTVIASDDVRLTQDTAPVAYTAGLTDWAAITPGTFYTSPPCASAIGDATNALRLDCPDVRIEHSHPFAHVEGVSGRIIAKMVLGSATGRAENYVSNATVTALYCQAGMNYVNATAEVGTVRVNGGTTTLRQGGAKGTAFHVAAGATLNCGRDSAAATVSGTLVLDHADAAIDAVTVNSGGRLICRKARPATLTREAGAVLDMSQSDDVFQSGTININGPVTVIPPRAPSAGTWSGSATVVAPAGETVTERASFGAAGVA